MTVEGWHHAEAACQMITGTVLAQGVLWCFDVPLGDALWINAVMFCVSYIRTYAIRRAFHAARSAE